MHDKHVERLIVRRTQMNSTVRSHRFECPNYVSKTNKQTPKLTKSENFSEAMVWQRYGLIVTWIEWNSETLLVKCEMGQPLTTTVANRFLLHGHSKVLDATQRNERICQAETRNQELTAVFSAIHNHRKQLAVSTDRWTNKLRYIYLYDGYLSTTGRWNSIWLWK